MTVQIALFFLVLAAAVYLFVSEKLRVDVVAILVMVTLPWLGLVEPADAFSGLASNAVIALIAIMILGHGVDRSGALNWIINFIVSMTSDHRDRLVLFVTTTVGAVSAFMQNVGAAALFLPAVLKISRRTGMPASRLLMPMGFAAILGGNLTMVGSTPLLMLNDLLRHGGVSDFRLFSVAPVGVVLVVAGALYFFFFGRSVLPGVKKKKHLQPPMSIQQMLIERWRIPTTIYRCRIPKESPLAGKTREDSEMWTEYRVYLLALADGEDVLYAPWRHTPFAAGQVLTLLGEEPDLERFVNDFELMFKKEDRPFEQLEETDQVGFAEMVIPVESPCVGKTIRDISIRKTYGVEPIMLFSGDRKQRGDFSDEPLERGNVIIVHGRWRQIRAMADGIHFMLITPIELAHEVKHPRPAVALLCFVGAVALAASGVPIALGLLTGALAMILFRIVPVDEAYRAVDWKTIFLLAGLIPLGAAMNHTGASGLLASVMAGILEGAPPLAVFVSFGLLATLLGLFISNVAATIILVPLVIAVAAPLGVSPRALALLVALCSSNTFMLPTNQVNALVMSPGGYRNADYLRAGAAVTVFFLVTAVAFVYFFRW
ncbi:MAG TPA: SLC13 family permease [Deltaproteobacteria bacterium]|nr:SLC13 family permease [Deltaproteobacteria bacterium]